MAPKQKEKKVAETADKPVEANYPVIMNLDDLLRIDDVEYDYIDIDEWKSRFYLKTLSCGEMGIIRSRVDTAEQAALMLCYAWIEPDKKRRVVGEGKSADDMLAFAQGLKAKSGTAFEKVSNKVNEMHGRGRKDAQKALSPK